jgi:uncharacterized membrane protein
MTNKREKEDKKVPTQEQVKEITPEETEERPKQEKEEEKAGLRQQKGGNKMPLTILIFLLITAIIKDFIQIVFGFIAFILPMLAPIIIVLAFIVCLPFTAFIFFITLLSGIRATWLFIGSIIDQLIPILPVATLTVILCYIFEKSPSPIKKTIEKTSKITSLTT